VKSCATEAELAAAYETVAREAGALALPIGPVYKLLVEAAVEIQAGDTDGARMSLDCAVIAIERVREKLDALDRGEVPV
jgi:hypothetical protein